MTGWENASPMEILDARVQSLEEGLQHLKWCVMEALKETAQRDTGGPYPTYGRCRPEDILDEEWSK